jgi:hypothetical protein
MLIIGIILLTANSGCVQTLNAANTTDFPALDMIVTVNRTAITNVTFEQTTVPYYYIRKDTPTDFPEVSAVARPNELESLPISYWASVHTPQEGIYNMRMVFKTNPQVNDTLIITLRYSVFGGTVIDKRTAFHIWE